jgi:5-methylcytosine-specific restriction endonuclease McrA
MDFSKYPKDWKAIRIRILDRDGWHCQRCLIEDDTPIHIIARGVWATITEEQYVLLKQQNQVVQRLRLQVAHINNIKNDISPENLISLCPLCHLRMDAPFKRMLRISNKDLR